jgi:hypothetical protein
LPKGWRQSARTDEEEAMVCASPRTWDKVEGEGMVLESLRFPVCPPQGGESTSHASFSSAGKMEERRRGRRKRIF